jgi:hypothetical protein
MQVEVPKELEQRLSTYSRFAVVLVSERRFRKATPFPSCSSFERVKWPR